MKNVIKYSVKLAVCILIYSYCSIASEIDKHFEEFLVTLMVNYQQNNSLSNIIRDNKGRIFILHDELLSANIEDNYLSQSNTQINGKKYCQLDRLPNLDYVLDTANLSLKLIFPIGVIKKQVFNLIDINTEHSNLNQPENMLIKDASFGAFLNYDITFSDRFRIVSGFQDFNYFTPAGVFNQTFVTTYSSVKNADRNKHFIRLDTNWTVDDEKNTAKLKIGDAITKPADWSNAARFLGVQYATDFAIRPNLVTYPLLNYGNSAELPSTLDIYTANQMQLYSGDVRAGEFDLNNIPVPTGKGDLIVRATDITGKIQTLIIPYYVSPQLLKQGLENFSYAAGTQRFNYGAKRNDKYKNFISNFDYSIGITDEFTNSTHFESQKTASVGNSIYYKVDHIGILSSSVAINLKSNIKQAQKFSLGFDYSSDNYSFNSTVSFGGRRFVDTYTNDYMSNGTSSRTSAGYYNDNLGNISLNYFTYPTDIYSKIVRIKTVGLNYSRPFLNDKVTFRLNAGKTLRGYKYSYITASLTFDLGQNTYGQASSTRQAKRDSQNIFIASPIQDNLGWGYQAAFTKGDINNSELKLSGNSSKINSNLYLYNSDNRFTQQLNFAGGIIGMEKELFFTQPIYDSFAVVKLERIQDMPIYGNNNLVTYTDSNGTALIPNLPSYVKSSISFDESLLPLDSSLSTNRLTVTPKWKAGTIARFNIRKTKPIEFTLINAAGDPMKRDSNIIIDGINEELFTGYDGLVFITDIGELNILKGKACSDKNCCRFEVPIDGNNQPSDLGEVTCVFNVDKNVQVLGEKNTNPKTIIITPQSYSEHVPCHPELVSGSKINRSPIIGDYDYYVFSEILKRVQDDMGRIRNNMGDTSDDIGRTKGNFTLNQNDFTSLKLHGTSIAEGSML